MTIYKADLAVFERILKKSTLDRTPSILIELSSDGTVLKEQLCRLNKAIQGTTRYISELLLCMQDGTPLDRAADRTIRKMYYTHVVEPLQAKVIKQKEEEEVRKELGLAKTIKKQPYGPYFDFFRTPKEPFDQAGKPFPVSEISELEEVPSSFFENKLVVRGNAMNNS